MTSMTPTLLELAERVINGTGPDNQLDVLVEIALFVPDEHFTAVRANAAGTKVIYKHRDGGKETTHWAEDWTMTRELREETAAALRARSRTQEGVE